MPAFYGILVFVIVLSIVFLENVTYILQYRKAVKNREEKQFKERLKQVPKKFLPLSPDNEKRVREADKYTWADFIRTNDTSLL